VGLASGRREYVTKPVNPALLLTAISEAMAA
jgi:DNA-binding response OmpR family regulator